jgi:bacterioferritin
MATKAEIIDALNAAYNKELETILNYLSCSIDIDGVRAEAIKNALAGDIQGELSHAQLLGARVRQLGGTVPGSLSLKMEQSFLQPPKDTADVVAVIKGVLAAEEDAIRTYTAIIKMCEGTDYVTQDLAIRILGDEEGHRQQFEGYLKEYTRG